MNAQYFAEISLGTPPQSVSLLPFYFRRPTTHSPLPTIVQGCPRYRVSDSPHQLLMSSSQHPPWLDRATSGSPAPSARLSRVSSTPSTILVPLRPTSPMEPALRSTMVLVPWRASSRTTPSASVISRWRVWTSPRLPKSQVSPSPLASK